MSYVETRRRSIAKAVSYRIVGTLVTAVVTYALTRELLFAMQLGLIDTLAKLGLFYIHERAWMKIGYGKLPPPDYQI